MIYKGLLQSTNGASLQLLGEKGVDRQTPSKDSLWCTGFIKNASTIYPLIVNFYNSRREEQQINIPPLTTLKVKNQNIDRLQLSGNTWCLYKYNLMLYQSESDEESRSLLIYSDVSLIYDGIQLDKTKTKHTFGASVHSGEFFDIINGLNKQGLVITRITAEVRIGGIPNNATKDDYVYIDFEMRDEDNNIIDIHGITLWNGAGWTYLDTELMYGGTRGRVICGSSNSMSATEIHFNVEYQFI